MGDQFEKFILENRGAFDDGAPSDALWSKIEKDVSKKKGFNATILWRAAAVLFLASTLYLLQDKLHTVEAPAFSSDFVEAESYYISLINQKKLEIEQNLSTEETNAFLSEINELDSMYTALKESYQKETTSDKILDAMIKNLQVRLDILNRQIEILEKINSQSNENETIQI